MIPLRLAFYALYVALGIVIIVRLATLGARWETISGMILGIALVALGVYRILTYVRLRRAQRE